jgi:penicillin-binding protein 2
MRFWNKNKNNENFDIFSVREGDFKFGKIKDHSYRREWVENAFSPIGPTRENLSRQMNFMRSYFFGGIIFLFLLLILGRSAWLQIVKGEYYYQMAEGNRVRIERIEAKRGVIYDSRMRPLVSNVANFLLYVIPSDLPQDEARRSEIIRLISGILGDIKESEISEKISKIKKGSYESFRPLFIEDNITYDKAMRLYLESNNWPGIVLSSKTRREYNLNAFSLSHLLGYTGKINEDELKIYGDEYLPIDYIGKMGIEYFWENELKGLCGQKQVEVDAYGKEKKMLAKNDPIDGNNLVLSINMDVQKKLEEILAAYLNKLKMKKASAIIMDPNNGEIIALVSLPAFDNNLFARGISSSEYNALISSPDKPLFDRAISGEYPSGSTIKPVIAAAALQEDIINENTTVVSTGGIKVDKWFFPDWKAGGHGVTDVKRAIAESINTFFYYIGGGYQDFKGLGVDKIESYEKLFGLGTQTGIDLAGEANGFLPTREWKEKTKKENWYIGDTYHVSIGQGDFLVTPLQVANYTSVFANGGSLYRPHLVNEIKSGLDKDFKKINEGPIRSNFIDAENIRIVREAMRRTVTSGSGRRLNDLPVAIAGKTGTAQSSASKTKTHAWFTGFAPYDQPKITITVLVDDAGGGDTVAVPIVRDFLSWYFRDSYPRSSTSSPIGK